MRLLNTATHALEEFVDDDHVPPYAILSHTWGAEEVTFKDLSSPPSNCRTYENKQGWRKIFLAMHHAAKNGWHYIWIDTCCIDKSDVTELSEAINSMFRWYECAEVCYAYLADVPPEHAALQYPWRWSFRSSRWFRRGWTLQELLAPSFLEFLDRDWNLIGSRDEWADEIELATGIEVRQLANFQQCSVATKLSWAANRETTRVEDRAYSLLGLLGVNMPLIYGEGERAFTRLQHELIRSSNDESIFAWGFLMSSGRALPIIRGGEIDAASGRHEADSPILAPSPRDYEHSRGIVTWKFDKRRKGFAMTNAGLSLNAELFKTNPNHADRHSLYLVQLNCCWAWPPLDAVRSPLVLFLRDPNDQDGHHGRIPLFFKRIRFYPQTWRGADSGQWQSLGRHDILIANETFHTVDPWREMESVELKFGPILTTCMNPVQTYHLARRNRHTGQWDITKKDWAPTGLAQNEAFVHTISTESPGRVGYLIIVKWSRWARRSLACGVWQLACPPSGPEDDMLRCKLESDQDRPYPSTAPIVPALHWPSEGTGVVALRINAKHNLIKAKHNLIQRTMAPFTIPPPTRQFTIALVVRFSTERKGRTDHRILPTLFSGPVVEPRRPGGEAKLWSSRRGDHVPRYSPESSSGIESGFDSDSEEDSGPPTPADTPAPESVRDP